MKIVKGDTYKVGRFRYVDITFSDVLVSDVEKMEKLQSENADIYVGKVMHDTWHELIRCNCGQSDSNNMAVALDASVIKGGTLDTIQIGKMMPEPKRIIRSGEYTTVLWKDGTKTIVKRMPGSEDSDYAAFTAALAKKVYGTNSNVERIVSMTERVKTKAEKKAEKKAKQLAREGDLNGQI